ncbi:MAG: hypothetical protein ACYDGW_04080 [Vulcanimicrobiaceae bacterium]
MPKKSLERRGITLADMLEELIFGAPTRWKRSRNSWRLTACRRPPTAAVTIAALEKHR